MRVFVVLNPVAGRTKTDDVRYFLDQYFSKPHWQLEIYETTGTEDVSGLVTHAIDQGAEMIFAAGGDGTVSAVVDGLARKDIPLGIIPTGTSNVLAQELGIPLSISKSCQMLSNQPATRTIDAIQMDNRYFVLSVGTRLDAIAIQGTGRKQKRRFGTLAYIWTVAKLAFGIQPSVFTIIADGEKKRARAVDVLITNISTLTRPLRWGPHITPDDGRIDICITRARNLFDIILVSYDILVPGRPRKARNLRYWSAESSVLVFSDKPLPVQGDGDVLGETPLEVNVVSGAVQVLVPAEKNGRNGMRIPLISDLVGSRS
jgi:YegS/Rv2252/BmrU family lipid kinase